MEALEVDLAVADSAVVDLAVADLEVADSAVDSAVDLVENSSTPIITYRGQGRCSTLRTLTTTHSTWPTFSRGSLDLPSTAGNK